MEISETDPSLLSGLVGCFLTWPYFHGRCNLEFSIRLPIVWEKPPPSWIWRTIESIVFQTIAIAYCLYRLLIGQKIGVASWLAMPCWWGPTTPKQLSMAVTAWVIWLCACVRYWPDRGLVFECVTCFYCSPHWSPTQIACITTICTCLHVDYKTFTKNNNDLIKPWQRRIFPPFK